MMRGEISEFVYVPFAFVLGLGCALLAAILFMGVRGHDIPRPVILAAVAMILIALPMLWLGLRLQDREIAARGTPIFKVNGEKR